MVRSKREVCEVGTGLDWHSLAIEEVFRELSTSERGLDEDEAKRRLELFCRNELILRKPPSLYAVFFRQFLSPLIYILMAAAILSLVIGEAEDFFFIAVVLLFNAVLGSTQEWRAIRSAEALQDLLALDVKVRRGGRERVIPSEDLVPGDIVFLEPGSKVPADVRLASATDLSINEALLTGEAAPASKITEPLDAAAVVSDRDNMAFAGTVVTGGKGLAVVTETRMNTQAGRIAGQATSGEVAESPLLIRMNRFTRWIGLFALGTGVLINFIFLFRGEDWAHALLLTAALLVAAIPEGLPIAVTVALSIGTKRMAARNVIVTRLSAVESLGSCTAIATDKTGTLTLNQQTAKRLVLPDLAVFDVTGQGYSGEGAVEQAAGGEAGDASLSAARELARVGAVVNDGHLMRDDGEWKYGGDVIDVAFLALAYKLGLAPEDMRNEAAVREEIPFSSERKYQAALYRAGSEDRVGVKGAPEVVIELCRADDTAGGGEPGGGLEAVERMAEELTEEGYRVLAVAEGRASDAAAGLREDELPPLTLLGMVAMIDPLRPEVPAAVANCHQAGVRVVMVTGDNPGTALAVAREAGIAGEWGEVMTGRELAALAPESAEGKAAINARNVFARVEPLQKVDIVAGLLGAGNFVAVTGDGVNDAPALRRANIGVAMGSGTDLAKDTAEIIIADDNFASIEAGIEQGRYAYDNIRKVVLLLISTGLAEVLLFLFCLVFNLPIALTAVQFLWLNLVTNGVQGVVLAFEGGEPGAMARAPRDPEERVFNAAMLQEVFLAGFVMGILAFVTWWWLIESGWELPEARNLVLLLMVMLESVQTFNSRSEFDSTFRVPLSRNWILVGGVIAAQTIQLGAIFLPFLHGVLETDPVTATEWFAIFGLSLLLLVVMELFKWARHRRARER
ncbi:MAG: cation-translocating P-type ATPase [Candidatus Geothermincolia bacterium]